MVGRLSLPNPASSLFIFQSLLWVLSICFCEWTQYLNAMLPQVSVFESLLSVFISRISPISLLSMNVTSMLKTQLCDSSHQQSSDLQTHVPNPYSTSPLAIQQELQTYYVQVHALIFFLNLSLFLSFSP